MDSARQARVVQYDPPLTPFDVDQWSFPIDLDIVLTMVQVLRLPKVMIDRFSD